ncbi:MAG: hypothetical protein S0880_04350 [Actinomycetota bacterium]|nr:hypothetical protein [Actinomycetota bacterium]
MTEVSTARSIETGSAALALAETHVLSVLAGAEKDSVRAERKARAVELRLAALSEIVGPENADPATPESIEEALASWGAHAEVARRAMVLLDIIAIPPFHPYELRTPRKYRRRAVLRLCELVELDKSHLSEIDAAVAEARSAHGKSTRSVSRIISGSGTYALGSLRISARVPSAIGAAVGLGGVPAYVHGLAELGDGRFPTAGLGFLGLGAGRKSGLDIDLTLRLSTPALERSLIRDQAALALMEALGRGDLAVLIESEMGTRLGDLRAAHDAELLLNDSGANRLAHIRSRLELVGRAHSWMTEHVASPG